MVSQKVVPIKLVVVEFECNTSTIIKYSTD